MGKKIIDYLTVSHNNLLDLDEGVRDFIKQGYEPFGNFVWCEGAQWEYIQAMVKYEENN